MCCPDLHILSLITRVPHNCVNDMLIDERPWTEGVLCCEGGTFQQLQILSSIFCVFCSGVFLFNLPALHCDSLPTLSLHTGLVQPSAVIARGWCRFRKIFGSQCPLSSKLHLVHCQKVRNADTRPLREPLHTRKRTAGCAALVTRCSPCPCDCCTDNTSNTHNHNAQSPVAQGASIHNHRFDQR